MHFRSSASTLLLLLLLLSLCLLGRVLEVKGQEREYLQEALRALDLPLGTNEPQLQKNHTGILITKLLRAVHCAERTGTSQDVCDKVRPINYKLSNFYIHILSTYYVFILHSCLLIQRNVLVMAGM